MSHKRKRNAVRFFTMRNIFFVHVAVYILRGVLMPLYWDWQHVLEHIGSGTPISLAAQETIMYHQFVSNFSWVMILLVHLVIVFGHDWWQRRRLEAANRQSYRDEEQMTADEKLNLLLDEVADLRAALQRDDATAPAWADDRQTARLIDSAADMKDEMILEDYQNERKARG